MELYNSGDYLITGTGGGGTAGSATPPPPTDISYLQPIMPILQVDTGTGGNPPPQPELPPQMPSQTNCGRCGGGGVPQIVPRPAGGTTGGAPAPAGGIAALGIPWWVWVILALLVLNLLKGR